MDELNDKQVPVRFGIGGPIIGYAKMSEDEMGVVAEVRTTSKQVAEALAESFSGGFSVTPGISGEGWDAKPFESGHSSLNQCAADGCPGGNQCKGR